MSSSERYNTSQTNDASSNSWDCLTDESYDDHPDYARVFYDPIAERKDTQRRKVAAAFSNMVNGYPNMSPLTYDDVDIPQDTYDNLLEDISNNAITMEQKKYFISCIVPPTDPRGGGIARVDSRLNDPRERRILGYMTSGAAGFNNTNLVSSQSISSFIDAYPTPIDFDDTSASFLDMIERMNGYAKRKTYEKAIDSFRHKIYGKQEEYWQAYKAIEEDAKARQAAKNNQYQDVHSPRDGGYVY